MRFPGFGLEIPRGEKNVSIGPHQPGGVFIADDLEPLKILKKMDPTSVPGRFQGKTLQ